MEKYPVSKSTICPYIGLYDDSDTSISYPSEHNYCHCFANVEPISLDHQQTFCLGPAYQGCPILISSKTDVAAAEQGNVLSRLSTMMPGANHKWVRAVVIGVVLVVIIGTLLAQTLRVASQQVIEPSPTATIVIPETSLPVVASPVKKTTSTPTVAASKTKQATPTVPSPVPSFTATILPSATTVKPTVTPNPNSFRLILHQVVAGDSLSLIAIQFHTTQEAIQTINYNFRAPLQQGVWIIIPANTTNVSALPQFEIIVNTQANITLKELAVKLQTSPELLAQYNDLKPDDKLKADQRIMVPRTIAK
jgi:LysM repeat protein